MVAVTAITDDPNPILAFATSALAPPAAKSALTCLLKGANGDRTPANFAIFAGVRIKGIINLNEG